MLVMNTWFATPDRNNVTHRAPGAKELPKPGEPWSPTYFGELDLCVVPTRWAGMIKDVVSITWASLNTDHFSLEKPRCP